MSAKDQNPSGVSFENVYLPIFSGMTNGVDFFAYKWMFIYLVSATYKLYSSYIHKHAYTKAARCAEDMSTIVVLQKSSLRKEKLQH